MTCVEIFLTADAAVREVREETGIETGITTSPSLANSLYEMNTEFRSVLAFRQHHHMPHAFGASDLYFVCRLHPLIFDLRPCEKEVLKCEWMSARELATSKEVRVQS